MSASKAKNHLRKVFPKLTRLFDYVDPIPLEVPDSRSLIQSITETVAGQMLSGKAAASICARMQIAANQKSLSGPHLLPEEVLRDCGLSRAKIRTIFEFAEVLDMDPQRFSRWNTMEFDELRKEINSFWGLSDWTAQMIAISHFGHQDIFPHADGTIIRATALVIKHLDTAFDERTGSPHRTLLSRYLWASIDKGFWKVENLD